MGENETRADPPDPTSTVESVDRSSYQRRRRGFLADLVDTRSTSGLEFGGFDLPTVAADQGSCAIADMRSEIHLAREFKLPLDSICPVDCIIEPGVSAYRQIGRRFDYVILCHVLEHIPDVITMMRDLTELLVPGGTLFIALPDKRETCDITRSSTTLSKLVERQLEQQTTPSLSDITEFALAWDEGFRKQYEESMQDFFLGLRNHQLFGSPDVHCNVWRDDEFLEQMGELIRGGYLPQLEIVASRPTEYPFNEFYVAFRRLVEPAGDGDAMPEPAWPQAPGVHYRSCNFCGYGQFEVWKRVAASPSGSAMDGRPVAAGRVHGLQMLTCRRCGLTAQNPMPGFADLDGAGCSPGPWPDRDDARLPALIEEERKRAEALSARHGLERYRSTGRLLGVSCGPGIGLAWLRDERGWDVRGVEPVRELVALARDRFGLELACGRVEDLEEPDGTFDVILIDGGLERMFDPLSALLACRRLLREGGCLVIHVPNRDGIGSERSDWIDQSVDREERFFFTPSVLHAILEQIGLDGQEILASQPEVGSALPPGAPTPTPVPHEGLEVSLRGAEEIDRHFASASPIRADSFTISASRSSGVEYEAAGKALDALREVAACSHRQRLCVAIDPETDARWPFESGSTAPAGNSGDRAKGFEDPASDGRADASGSSAHLSQAPGAFERARSALRRGVEVLKSPNVLDRFDFVRCPNCLSRLRERRTVLECPECTLSYASSPPRLLVDAAHFGDNARAREKARGYRLDWSRMPRSSTRPAEQSSSDALFDAEIASLFATDQPFLEIGLNPNTYFGERYARELGEVDLVRVDYDADKRPDLCGDVQLLPIADDSVASIACLSVLEHVRNPFAAVEELYRVLQPGGLLYLWVPWVWLHHDPVDLFRFSHQSFDWLTHMFERVTVYPSQSGLGHALRGMVEPLYPAAGGLPGGVDLALKQIESDLHAPERAPFRELNPIGHAVFAQKAPVRAGVDGG